MTFEEAIEQINEQFTDPQVPGYSIGDFDPEFIGSHYDVMEIFESLQETYAPNTEIPKWIADSFDKLISTSVTKYHGVADAWDYVVSENGFKEFGKWTDTNNAEQITIAYLNPLTRKFVEVIE